MSIGLQILHTELNLPAVSHQHSRAYDTVARHQGRGRNGRPGRRGPGFVDE